MGEGEEKLTTAAQETRIFPREYSVGKNSPSKVFFIGKF